MFAGSLHRLGCNTHTDIKNSLLSTGTLSSSHVRVVLVRQSLLQSKDLWITELLKVSQAGMAQNTSSWNLIRKPMMFTWGSCADHKKLAYACVGLQAHLAAHRMPCPTFGSEEAAF